MRPPKRSVPRAHTEQQIIIRWGLLHRFALRNMVTTTVTSWLRLGCFARDVLATASSLWLFWAYKGINVDYQRHHLLLLEDSYNCYSFSSSISSSFIVFRTVEWHLVQVPMDIDGVFQFSVRVQNVWIVQGFFQLLILFGTCYQVCTLAKGLGQLKRKKKHYD